VSLRGLWSQNPQACSSYSFWQFSYQLHSLTAVCVETRALVVVLMVMRVVVAEVVVVVLLIVVMGGGGGGNGGDDGDDGAYSGGDYGIGGDSTYSTLCTLTTPLFSLSEGSVVIENILFVRISFGFGKLLTIFGR
jgi:hypothetical protein